MEILKLLKNENKNNKEKAMTKHCFLFEIIHKINYN